MNPKIIRTYSAGVFYSPTDIVERSQDGRRGIIVDSRRLWYWSGAASLSQLAMEGVVNPKECKFAMPVGKTELTDIIEVLDVTPKAKEIIEGVGVWKR